MTLDKGVLQHEATRAPNHKMVVSKSPNLQFLSRAISEVESDRGPKGSEYQSHDCLTPLLLSRAHFGEWPRYTLGLVFAKWQFPKIGDPQYTMILIIRTPNEGPLICGTPQICWINTWKSSGQPGHLGGGDWQRLCLQRLQLPADSGEGLD